MDFRWEVVVAVAMVEVGLLVIEEEWVGGGNETSKMENWVPNAFDFQVVELLIEEQGKEAILEPDRPLGKFVRPSGFNPTRVIQLSSHSMVFLYEAFLSEEECDHLITLCSGTLFSGTGP
ncbi:hypothetical protein QJS10_CPA06g01514 [Acorus calamus]|uniref:Uncharacterized protein n=1 Tax=Acorus calamus TaxID=4465 RepID=A0AAV9ETB4_ACOCL|nr:hypothetical protein QJS10_CPA06g01514 [Acorus calamus]